MDVGKVISALDSGLRREILSILSKEPMTVIQVLGELKKRTNRIRYRETVYRALEKLVDSELVQKYYDREKGLYYKLSATRLAITITRESIEIKIDS
jgi:Fe2+ or Zn2+ uptake regulation protein